MSATSEVRNISTASAWFLRVFDLVVIVAEAFIVGLVQAVVLRLSESLDGRSGRLGSGSVVTQTAEPDPSRPLRRFGWLQKFCISCDCFIWRSLNIADIAWQDTCTHYVDSTQKPCKVKVHTSLTLVMNVQESCQLCTVLYNFNVFALWYWVMSVMHFGSSFKDRQLPDVKAL